MPLAVDLSMDTTTWGALALVLTLLGALLSWVAWRRRGPAAGLRGLAWTLLPLAAWLTGTLRLAVNIAEDVLSWATHLVFSPTVWLGLAVGGAAVGLWFLSGLMLARGVGVRGAGPAVEKPAAKGSAVKGAGRTKQVPAAPRDRATGKRGAAAKDDDLDDMADIEAILKKHGI
jgi:hypothetical protein